MKQAIFRGTLFLALVTLVVVTLLVSGIFYSSLSQSVQDDLRTRIRPFANATHEEALFKVSQITSEDMRITLISSKGEIVFDNTAPKSEWESHLDRVEFQEALDLGEGSSNRKSDTVGKETYYFAVRLNDGYVLRGAETISSIWEIYSRGIPVMLLTLGVLGVCSYIFSNRVARNIIEPISTADPRAYREFPYDELEPFALAIAEQQEKIEHDKEKLAERSRTINAVMENVSEGIVLFGREGRVLSLNKRAQDILDVDSSFEGRGPIELIRDLNFEELVNSALHGERGYMSFAKGGCDYRLIVSPAELVGAVLLILDITEAEQSERIRREFSANVSHELKTPLTSVYGSAEMLKLNLVKEEDRSDFYEKMMRESSRLINLVDDIMLLSRLDEGKSQKLDDTVDMAELAANCKDELMSFAEKRGIDIAINGFASTHGNKSLLHDLMYNLIENAIKYNKPGGSVEVSLEQAGQRAKISVSDTGIGMNPESRERIFERFYRIEGSRSRDLGGTGLGLAIVKHIIQLHSGSIEVVSEPNKGSTFLIEI